ncbi:MAG: hypothetical protein GXO86_05525 [Chlorobi bacterium]|nr:hypothetical protein [Chlorobiota bacterium]
MNQFSIFNNNNHVRAIHIRELAEATGIPEQKLKVGIKYQSLQKQQLLKIHNYLNAEKAEKKIRIPRFSLYNRKDFSLAFMSSKIFL